MTKKSDTKLAAVQAVILARVSSKDQEEGYSIDAQRHRLEVYCQRRGLEVLRVYEITESSTRGDRKKFMDMIKFCKSQKKTVAIVADKIDRVQRSFTEQPLLDSLIKAGKIELHFNTEGYVIHRDSMSQERLMWSFGIIMAQSYVDSLSDNVKRSFEHKIKSGEFVAKAPVGYVNTREHGRATIVTDIFRSHYILRIFTEYATGLHTIPEMTKLATDWGLRMKNGKPTNRSQMHKLLNNPFYYGVMKIKDKLYPHKYSPIIDKKLFDECQKVMKGWKRQPFNYGEREYVFRGLLSCKATGQTVSAYTKTKPLLNGSIGEWTYLRSWNKEGKAIYTREEKVLEQVKKAFKALVVPSDLVEAIIQEIRDTERLEREFLHRKSEELKKEDGRIQDRLDGIMDLLMDGAISRDEFDNRRLKLRERQVEIVRELAAHRDSDDGFKKAMLFFLDLCTNVEDLFEKATKEEKRRYLNLVFSNLELDGRTLCFSYKLPFSEYIELAKSDKWWQIVDMFRNSTQIRNDIINLYKALN